MSIRIDTIRQHVSDRLVLCSGHQLCSMNLWLRGLHIQLVQISQSPMHILSLSRWQIWIDSFVLIWFFLFEILRPFKIPVLHIYKNEKYCLSSLNLIKSLMQTSSVFLSPHPLFYSVIKTMFGSQSQWLFTSLWIMSLTDSWQCWSRRYMATIHLSGIQNLCKTLLTFPTKPKLVSLHLSHYHNDFIFFMPVACG